MFHRPRLSRKSGRGRTPYCTTATTLKNRIAALSAAVAPSAAFHSPSNAAAPFSTVYSNSRILGFWEVEVLRAERRG